MAEGKLPLLRDETLEAELIADLRSVAAFRVRTRFGPRRAASGLWMARLVKPVLSRAGST
jgi:hypothetical protein